MTDDELDQRLRDSILSEEIDTSRVELAVRNQIRTNPRHVPGWAVAAAALIAMVLAGGLSYRMFRKEQTPPICLAAAQDHEREIVNGEARPWLSDMPAIESLQRGGILRPEGADRLGQCLTPDGALRLLPGALPTDGFYVALIERSA